VGVLLALACGAIAGYFFRGWAEHGVARNTPEAWEWAYAMVRRQAISGCHKLAVEGESVTTRANALAAAAMLEIDGLSKRTRPRVVRAYLTKPSGWPNETWLSLEAVAGSQERDRLVVVFKGFDGGTIIERARLETDDLPTADIGIIAPVAFLPLSDFEHNAHPLYPGVRVVDCAKLHKLNPNLERHIPLPDAEMAVGLMFPDGTMTNFIPIERHPPREIRMFGVNSIKPAKSSPGGQAPHEERPTTSPGSSRPRQREAR